MHTRATFISGGAVRGWLGQFELADQAVAAELLDDIRFVNQVEFVEHLRALVLRRGRAVDGAIGLYAERELNHRGGVPHRLFKETEGKVKRAYGAGPEAVRPLRAYDQDVGSEGIVAQLISEVCRQFPTKFVSHPGPDQIRKKCVRRIIIVTDFIGSGNRALRYLGAAWKVRSVRSWVSSKQKTGLRMEVLAYSATRSGRWSVESHRSQPEVHLVRGCSTIREMSDWQKRLRLTRLCRQYDPAGKGGEEALGYEGAGALIAFAHGVPNNAPRILHASGKSWVPLFPARVTAATRQSFPDDENDASMIAKKLVAMRQSCLAKVSWLEGIQPHLRVPLLVLAALARAPRDTEVISSRTGLTILDVDDAVWHAFRMGWIDGRRRLTERGHAELKSARRSSTSEEALPEPAEMPYYPNSLRVPVGVSR